MLLNVVKCREMSLNVTACHDEMVQMLYYVGFATGEGVIVVGGFYNKVARESSKKTKVLN